MDFIRVLNFTQRNFSVKSIYFKIEHICENAAFNNSVETIELVAPSVFSFINLLIYIRENRWRHMLNCFHKGVEFYPKEFLCKKYIFQYWTYLLINLYKRIPWRQIWISCVGANNSRLFPAVPFGVRDVSEATDPYYAHGSRCTSPTNWIDPRVFLTVWALWWALSTSSLYSILM